MNYATYKTLPAELKEEYRWKFYDRATPKPYFIIGFTGFMIMGILTSAILILTIGVHPELSNMSPRVPYIMDQLKLMLKLINSMLIPFVVVELLRCAYYPAAETYWLRKHKIKSVYWWSKKVGEWTHKTSSPQQ